MPCPEAPLAGEGSPGGGGTLRTLRTLRRAHSRRREAAPRPEHSKTFGVVGYAEQRSLLIRGSTEGLFARRFAPLRRGGVAPRRVRLGEAEHDR